MDKPIQTKKDLLTYLEECVKEYAPLCKQSITRNNHMYSCDLGASLRQKEINTILVDFVNFVGSHQGLDWGCKTDHLFDVDEKEENPVHYVVHYKWQDGSELFFNRLFVKSSSVNNEDDLKTLEDRLITMLFNYGMEE